MTLQVPGPGCCPSHRLSALWSHLLGPGEGAGGAILSPNSLENSLKEKCQCRYLFLVSNVPPGEIKNKTSVTP